MPIFNYGGRNGVSSVIKFTILLCNMWMANENAITSFINGVSGISPEQKTTVLTWLSGVTAACNILKIIKVDYEA